MREALSLSKVRGVYDRAARRYDWQHGLATLKSDQRGRRMVVEWGVSPGDHVLDAGGGTGLTGMLAAQAVGPGGHVTVLDLSESMLAEAQHKAEAAGLADRMDFIAGDLMSLPFEAETFDAVLSTYSICPLYDPGAGALELYRVLKPGKLLSAAHSVEPQGRIVRKLAEWVEAIVWRLPWLSLGCRAVEVLPALTDAGAELVRTKRIGVPLWPFIVFSVRKPA